jgi:hypothetical protein
MALRLSASRAGRPFPPGRFAESTPPRAIHNAAGRLRLIEKSNVLIGKRTRDLPACSIVNKKSKATGMFNYYFFISDMTVTIRFAASLSNPDLTN